MENIVFDQWINLGSKTEGLLKIAKKITDSQMLIVLCIRRNNIISTKQLSLKGRVVASENGAVVDFGTAYPYATEEGKITITKQFMKAFIE